MTELVPFQTKRKKEFKEGTLPADAVLLELKNYFEKKYPTLACDEQDMLETVPKTIIFGMQKVQSLTLPTLAYLVALFTSPDLATQSKSFDKMELLQLSTTLLAKRIEVKRAYQIYPKPYQKVLKRFFTSEETNVALATEFSSKKKAKKYLRILIKRMGFYTQKKAPFIKGTLTST